MVVSINGDTQKLDGFYRENASINGWQLGVALWLRKHPHGGFSMFFMGLPWLPTRNLVDFTHSARWINRNSSRKRKARHFNMESWSTCGRNFGGPSVMEPSELDPLSLDWGDGCARKEMGRWAKFWGAFDESFLWFYMVWATFWPEFWAVAEVSKVWKVVEDVRIAEVALEVDGCRPVLALIT